MSEQTRPNSQLLIVAFVLLAGICLYQAYRLSALSSQLSESDLSPEMLAQCVLAADTAIQNNQISEEALAPRLLDDVEETVAYVEAFPVDEYRVYPMPGSVISGNLLLDDAPDVIKDELKAGNLWEPSVVRMIVNYAKRGTTMLDVGAHIGAHTLVMSKLAGPVGRVYAFEPQRKVYRELVHNMRLNQAFNVVPMRYAAGDTNAVIEMNPSTAGNEGGTSVGTGGDQAELRTIDSFGFRNVSLMKLDVEQLEDHVLEGARQTIMSNKPVILVEIQGGYVKENAPPEVVAKIAGTIQRIEDMNYSVVRFGDYDYIAFPIET